MKDSVYRGLMRELKKGRKLHLTLIDPEKQSSEEAGRLAIVVKEAKTDAILIGGSTSVKQDILDQTVIEVKKTKLPVIIFPSGVNYLSIHADAVFFLCLLNSRNVRFVIREQTKGAPIIKKMNLETISVGYILIEPGMRVGEVGQADLIQREDIDSAINYALAAQYFGFKFIYLEAGSGSLYPVSNKMITKVKREIDIPLIVGGGIRTRKIAEEKLEAGADILVTGNIIEEKRLGRLEKIIKKIKSAQ